ncbi:hypothetical protein NZD89_07970 [Alicyclobacillus fastidiosus]|uniref:DUF4064 domain-containing protein n=1 Tax=Alicyclobacillus fastidiosus TaxID=392011 RepID=A0ABY6ZMG9_9BACL|nr:hypothetical protein [Alicyclobacillus fastidiosus]WAH43316.1 hypothetical protein NZD89_07970 [Alicyclobacillus fastidiosus]GMA65371.1 hypothetical protein GCM10025859_58110 [Alicyclobacillus fastidiosus]
MIPLLLGLIAGLIGVVESLIKMAENYGNYPGVNYHTIGMLVVSAVSVFATLMARRTPKLSGVIMIVAAVLGFIFVTFSYLPSGVLLLLSGVVSLFSSPEVGEQRTSNS